jgi:hypothetical protein
MLTDGGRMGWILPEALLHVDYGKQILHWVIATGKVHPITSRSDF